MALTPTQDGGFPANSTLALGRLSSCILHDTLGLGSDLE